MYRKMNTTSLTAVVGLMVLIVGSFPVCAFDVVTIVGKVSPTNQIAVGDEIYEVDDTPQGNDLVKNYIGKKVKVTGKLRIEGDMRIIDVTKFEVVN
jgi:hypothetical protein